MTTVAAELEIAAPADRIYDVVTDAERLDDWLTLDTEVADPPPQPLREGAEFEQEVTVKGADVTVRWTATTAERPRLVELEGEAPGGARARARVELEALDDDRTRVAYRCDYAPPGGIFGRVVDRATGGQSAVSQQAERSLERLAALISS
jgi:uncharacterized membrane protein